MNWKQKRAGMRLLMQASRQLSGRTWRADLIDTVWSLASIVALAAFVWYGFRQGVQP